MMDESVLITHDDSISVPPNPSISFSKNIKPFPSNKRKIITSQCIPHSIYVETFDWLKFLWRRVINIISPRITVCYALIPSVFDKMSAWYQWYRKVQLVNDILKRILHNCLHSIILILTNSKHGKVSKTRENTLLYFGLEMKWRHNRCSVFFNKCLRLKKKKRCL